MPRQRCMPFTRSFSNHPRAALLLWSLIWIAACSGASAESLAQIESARRGARVMEKSGCAACHDIPGFENSNGGRPAGPPLDGWGDRRYIAGILTNTPEQLQRWLRNPQSVKPGDAMPNLGLSEAEAADVAAYLSTLR